MNRLNTFLTGINSIVIDSPVGEAKSIHIDIDPIQIECVSFDNESLRNYIIKVMESRIQEIKKIEL